MTTDSSPAGARPEFDFGAFPALETERLVLREFLESDAEDLLVYRS